jgi:heme/copper-type cytochrome/quinol oxidase subunit 3
MSNASSLTPGNLGIENKKLGMLFFIVSEIMFFTGLAGAYLVLRHSAASWPAAASLLDRSQHLFNAAILMTSCAAIAASSYQFKKNREGAGLTLLLITLFAGLFFIALQLAEYRELLLVKSVPPSKSVLAASYYVLSGFHVLHVFAGVIWMAFAAGRGRDRISVPGLQAFSFYWYFVAFIAFSNFALLFLTA